mmetsp:Transcript_11523/g.28200  ORF Transcript_11523/g.28200 Transcript_11523/m.28200 type:complete len:504 (-) Transcript_11523:797-2308(-)
MQPATSLPTPASHSALHHGPHNHSKLQLYLSAGVLERSMSSMLNPRSSAVLPLRSCSPCSTPAAPVAFSVPLAAPAPAPGPDMAAAEAAAAAAAASATAAAAAASAAVTSGCTLVPCSAAATSGLMPLTDGPAAPATAATKLATAVLPSIPALLAASSISASGGSGGVERFSSQSAAPRDGKPASASASGVGVTARSSAQGSGVPGRRSSGGSVRPAASPALARRASSSFRLRCSWWCASFFSSAAAAASALVPAAAAAAAAASLEGPAPAAPSGCNAGAGAPAAAAPAAAIMAATAASVPGAIGAGSVPARPDSCAAAAAAAASTVWVAAALAAAVAAAAAAAASALPPSTPCTRGAMPMSGVAPRSRESMKSCEGVGARLPRMEVMRALSPFRASSAIWVMGPLCASSCKSNRWCALSMRSPSGPREGGRPSPDGPAPPYCSGGSASGCVLPARLSAAMRLGELRPSLPLPLRALSRAVAALAAWPWEVSRSSMLLWLPVR